MTSLALAEWKRDVLETAADRFERRLTGESAALRLDMANLRAELKSDMARLHGSLIKWMFAFWIGQLAIALTIVGVMLRAVRLL